MKNKIIDVAPIHNWGEDTCSCGAETCLCQICLKPTCPSQTRWVPIPGKKFSGNACLLCIEENKL